MVAKLFLLVLLATVIIDIDAVYPFFEEKPCINASGFCSLRDQCSSAVWLHSNLCPNQKHLGAICCSPDDSLRRSNQERRKHCYEQYGKLICPGDLDGHVYPRLSK